MQPWGRPCRSLGRATLSASDLEVLCPGDPEPGDGPLQGKRWAKQNASKISAHGSQGQHSGQHSTWCTANGWSVTAGRLSHSGWSLTGG